LAGDTKLSTDYPPGQTKVAGIHHGGLNTIFGGTPRCSGSAQLTKYSARNDENFSTLNRFIQLRDHLRYVGFTHALGMLLRCRHNYSLSMTDIVIGNPVLASTRKDLHSDNSSCHC
jgi:hypothetical protein